MFKLINKNVLVTGSARGIGRAIAIEFAKAGYNVIINCIKSEEMLYELKKNILKLGVDCEAYVGDVGDSVFVQNMFNKISARFGHLDVLVNNAGISYVGLLTDMTDDEWNRILQTNLSSVFYCSREAARLMLRNKSGHIINISSMWGSQGASCEAAYSATKGGVDSFTKALAKELAPSGINVNAIACGVIDTDMNRCFSDEERAELADSIPAGRFGEAYEVGELAVKLASCPDYLTGQIIRIDGGFI